MAGGGGAGRGVMATANSGGGPEGAGRAGDAKGGNLGGVEGYEEELGDTKGPGGVWVWGMEGLGGL